MTPSSPILFPSSSPASQRTKRPRHNEATAPRTQAAPRRVGGFMMDSDDEDESIAPLAKKRMTESQATLPRTVGGFMMDMDSEDEDVATGPLAKNRMPESQPKTAPPSALEAVDSQSPATDSLPGARLEPPEFPTLADDPVDLSQVALLGPVFATATRTYSLKTCNGGAATIGLRKSKAPVSFESIVSARSRTKEGRAKRAYYGIEIHELARLATLEIKQQKEASQQRRHEPIVDTQPALSGASGRKSRRGMLWTEKYRARKFTDLCGDDGTNRNVLRWIKRWDPMVFPGSSKPKPKPKPAAQNPGDGLPEVEKPHRKILLLTGPPGLGKTTLAHVCARQAGYEVVEINASDDRSKNVVNNRIRTSLGTENVKTLANGTQKSARPVCVIVDEVDGVTTGSGASGEGGFIKALVDLVLVDQKNASIAERGGSTSAARKKKKGDDFRQRRPLILICNDFYHPSLRPLRQSNLAEVIHVGKPTIDAVVGRLSLVFEKEGIPYEKDAARKLCEAAWGMASGIDKKKGAESTVQGDLRGVMVVGEWAAGRFRAMSEAPDCKLTRTWVEKHVMQDLDSGGAGARGTGRGGAKDIVSRVFQEGAGFPREAMKTSQDAKLRHEQPKEQLGFFEFHKHNGMAKLHEMVQTSGDVDRIMSDIISEYPIHDFNDDCYLTKPNEAYDWLHFLDSCQTRLYSGQEWELAPYLSQPVLACHSIFASSARHHTSAFDAWGVEEGVPGSRFFGPRASYNAHEGEKHNRAVLQAMQGEFSPTLGRLFRSPEDLATDFMPYLTRLVSPAVNPVLVGGGSGGKSTASVRKDSEKKMLARAAEVMADVGLALQKGVLEDDALTSRGAQFVYRMEPDLDELADFETLSRTGLASSEPTRYAVRQALDQELLKVIAAREGAARHARFEAGHGPGQRTDPEAAPRALAAPPANDKENDKENGGKPEKVRRDFFGRALKEGAILRESDSNRGGSGGGKDKVRVWVKYHEGLNNAVRKPITVRDFMKVL